MGSNEMHQFTVEFIRETEMAILVEYKNEELWFPKSQIEWIGGAEEGDEIEIEVPEWLAEDKGILE